MVTPRRILFLHPSAELYGADRTLLDLIARLDPKEYDVHVAIPGDGPLLGELRSLGAQVHDGPLGVAAASNLTPTGLLRLARNLPKSIYFLRKPHPHDRAGRGAYQHHGRARRSDRAGRSRAAHLWHIHEIPTRPKALPRLAAWLMTRYADQVVFNSHATAHTFLRHSRTLWKRSMVVHNGIDPTRLNPLPEKETARERLGWPQSSPSPS
ncbi:MAG: glycosyltransferase [Planctomycetota bacterium]